MLQFTLNTRIKADSFFVADLELCQIRLMNNSYFTWFLLIPRLNDIINLTDLSIKNQQTLMAEINHVAGIAENLFKPTRLNIGALGNIVSQMHWHIIVRHDTDKAWPNPVWGFASPHYTGNTHEKIIALFNDALKNGLSESV
jgi:diadenosine tetraphosphate (Ap4A) HIT family hydrolase